MRTFIVFLIGLVIGIGGAAAAVWFTSADMMVNEQQSPVGIEETVKRIQKAAEDAKWKVLAVRKLHESINAHSKVKVLPLHLIDLCEPNHAGQMMSVDTARKVSVFMPCTISVYTKTDGKTYVASTNAGLLGKLFGGVVADVMGGEVAEAQEGFLEAIDKPATP